MMQKIIFMLLVSFVFQVVASSHHPEEFLNQISGKTNEGALIVEHFCVNCHAEKPMIPLGAPRMGVVGDWDPRVKPGFEVLLNHTTEGLNAMPARGGCFECTDEQLILAILEMLPDMTPLSFIPPIERH